MAKFEITKRKNGEWQFTMKSGNGDIILKSEGYTRRTSCLNGINSVKTNSKIKARFELKSAKNGKHYFNLKAINGLIIGTSPMFNDEKGRTLVLNSIMKTATAAAVQDLTL